MDIFEISSSEDSLLLSSTISKVGCLENFGIADGWVEDFKFPGGVLDDEDDDNAVVAGAELRAAADLIKITIGIIDISNLPTLIKYSILCKILVASENWVEF